MHSGLASGRDVGFKWDVQLWGFGSLFLNSLMHCLAEHPKKKKKYF
jgi:hypothetical protein